MAKRFQNTALLPHIKPLLNRPRMFHLLGTNPVFSACIYLTKTPPASDLFSVYDPKLSFSNLEVYTVRVGALDGMVTGYLFNSPLVIRHDYYFVVFHRKRCDPMRDIVNSGIDTVRRFAFDNINLNSNEFGYFLTLKSTDNVFTKFASHS